MFEVLAPFASRASRIAKLGESFATLSIQRYVNLEQNSAAATVFVRGRDAWLASVPISGDTIGMPEIGTAFPLAGIYAGTELAQPELNEV